MKTFQKPKPFTLILSYDQTVEYQICNRNDVLENILRNIASRKGINHNSLIFFYNGCKIDNTRNTINQIINHMDSDDNKMIIIAYDKDENEVVDKPATNLISINFILSSDDYCKKELSRDKTMKTVCYEYAKEKSLELNSLIFKYGGKEIDLDQKFDDIANKYDKKCLGMTIEVYNRKSLSYLKVNFFYKSKSPYSIQCYKEDKIIDIIDEYTLKKSLTIDQLSFYYGAFPIDIYSDQTFYQLINNKKNNNNNDIIIYTNEKAFDDNINEIDITVKDLKQSSETNQSSGSRRNKNLIIAISIVLILIVVILIIVFFALIKRGKEKYKKEETKTKEAKSLTRPICDSGYFIPDDDNTFQDCQKCSLEGCQICNGTYKKNECSLCGGNLEAIYSNNKIIKCNNTCEIGEEEKCLTCYRGKNECKSCNIGYKLVNGKCKTDYTLKITYLSTSVNESVKLIYSIYRVEKMIIDGIIVTPVTSYNFPNIGYHTVYYKFMETYAPSNRALFQNLNSITEVSFSNFDEYIPDIDFELMFRYCTNLTSVDLSKFAVGTKANFNLHYMFKGCINLKYVNLNLTKLNVGYEANNMFDNCKSLTSIDLSKFNFEKTTNFENMFYNCISLKSINLKGVYLRDATKINFMFDNCISLESLDLSSFQPNKLNEMKSVFSNCNNLSYINLNNFQTHNVVNMNKLFYNCTSLTSINITNFNTQNVQTFTDMFGYCSSLETINISNFDTRKATDISGMFSHCYSLTSINLNNFVTAKVVYMTSLFSHCYSLTSIDLSNFNTEKVEYFESMFSHCYSLKSINVLHFNTSNFRSIKSMFSGCYSLTSIDLSNFDTKYSHSYKYIFHDCPNLQYVNIEPFFYDLNDNDLFNKNISSNGTLIINRQYYDAIKRNNYIPANWTIIFPN